MNPALLSTPLVGTNLGSRACLTDQAGYSSDCRRERAILPQAPPLNSINHERPSIVRSSSTMNMPRQPHDFTKVAIDSFNSSGTFWDMQALEPDPCGFIIRRRRCALHAATP